MYTSYQRGILKMKKTEKHDLRFVKNENLIRKIFREMMDENEYSKISIKELTERAQINRKTFYLHHPSLDHLLAALQLELMSPALEKISKTDFPDDAEQIIQHSFEFMASLDLTDKKILSSKGHFPEGLNPPDLFREYFFRKYDRLPGYTRFETNLIITYFSVSLGVIYRQWEVDGQRIPLEEMVPLATSLILHGLDGAGLVEKHFPPENERLY